MMLKTGNGEGCRVDHSTQRDRYVRMISVLMFWRKIFLRTRAFGEGRRSLEEVYRLKSSQSHCGTVSVIILTP